MTYKLNVSFNEVMDIYCRNHKLPNKEALRKAYEYAEEKHKGIFRGTGEPYIFHPLRVARFLAEWGFESDVLIASLLHDIVEDSSTPLSEIESLFGSNVADLVDTVTALTDKDFADQTLSKRQIDILSDARLQKKMNTRALYIKIADRLDNLNTLAGVKEERRIPKAEHTREIIIPMARLIHAYNFVDQLEELCFKTEHQKMYEDITRIYQNILSENNRKCKESIGFMECIFGRGFFNLTLPGDTDGSGKNKSKADKQAYENSTPPADLTAGSVAENQSRPDDYDDNTYKKEDLESYHRYIIDFQYKHRSAISIFRQLCRNADNIKKDLPGYLTKENIPLFDLTLIVSNRLSLDNSKIRPEEIFFCFFEQILTYKNFHLDRYCLTSHEDTGYFIISDEMDNMYRLFVRTELEYQRYLYGDIVDEDSSLTISNINELDPRETYNEKIKVFRRDSTAMLIDKGATVLDFAFHIHSELGYHFKYAMVDESKTQLPLHTRLNEGDTITVVANNDVTPDITWFRHVKTRMAVNYLVHYFQIHGLKAKSQGVQSKAN